MEKEMRMSDYFKGRAVVEEIIGNRKQGAAKFVLSDRGVFSCGLSKEKLKAAAHAINSHDAHLERIDEIEKLLYLIRCDLMTRGDNDKDSGVLHINLRHELWLRLDEEAKAWTMK